MRKDHVETKAPSVSARLSGSVQLLDLLKDWGVEYVFTCPGSTEGAFLTAAANRSSPKVMLTTHESIAVSMADGFSRVTGAPAVAYLHTNVGLTNGLSHLYAAQLAHSSVIVLNGLKSTKIQNRGGFTTSSHIRDFVRQYVKWDWQVLSADAVLEDVNRAIKVSTTEPQGPTWVGLSQDLMESTVTRTMPDYKRSRVSGIVRPADNELEAAAQMLALGKRVLIVAGAEVKRSEDEKGIELLAELLNAPVVDEDRRTAERSAFNTKHSSYGGRYSVSRASIQNADVVFLVSARSFIEFEPTSPPDIPQNASVIHLYPDPLEIAKTFGVDVPLVGSVATTVGRINELLRARASGPEGDPRYLHEVRAEQEKITATSLECKDSPGNVLSITSVMNGLIDAIPEGNTIVADSITSNSALFLATEQMRDTKVIASASGSLGWGFGAALGIQLGEPGRRVLAVLGDGGLQFGIQGLWTAARYRIPVVFLVINNQSYAAIGAAVQRFKGSLSPKERAEFVDLRGPNLAAVAQGFGLSSHRATTLEAVQSALADAYQREEPCLIEVITDPEALGPEVKPGR